VAATFLDEAPALQPFINGFIALNQCEHGDRDGARTTLGTIMKHGLDDVQLDFSWIGTVCLAAHASCELGDAESAARIYDVLAPWRDHYVDAGPAWFGSASHYLGRLAAALKRTEVAHGHFADAIDAEAAASARAHLAHTLVSWAELLKRDPGPPGAPDVSEAAQRALTLARELRLEKVEARATSVLGHDGS
jgi:hypothetical protein